jgi:glutathione S-transferase
MFDSPFVRRVAVSMNVLGIAFEHRNWSVGKDFHLVRQFNPVGRVPSLILADGEALVESSAILDFIDEYSGAAVPLLPKSGKDRRDALRIMSLAIGAAEKGVAQLYETAFRPAEKRHPPWTDRCRTQMQAALAEVDRIAQSRTGEWLIGNSLSQADITAACVFTFLSEALDVNRNEVYPGLAAITARCEARREFSASKAAFFPPGQGGLDATLPPEGAPS